MNTSLTVKNYLSILFMSLFLMSCGSSGDDGSKPDGGTDEPDIIITPDESDDLAIEGTMRNLTSQELVAEMGVGWNLGNSLDVKNRDKTAWGNPLPSQQIIDRVIAMGFTTIRIPVTWQYNQSNSAPYTIESSYLDRVQQTVNYAISKDLHTIIDVHHDEEWLRPTQADGPAAKARLASLWTQVAERFKVYGDKLIFETLNETRLLNSAAEWTGGTAEGRTMINEFHAAALDAIRGTGGNNATRHIMMSTYAASTVQAAMDDLVVPNNDANVIISLHTYFPWRFTGEEGGVSTWGSAQEKADLEAEFERIYNHFVVGQNRAVILGEWGARDRNNLSVREEYFQFYVEKATERGLLPIVWDDGGNFRLLDRANLNWHFQSLAETIIDAGN